MMKMAWGDSKVWMQTAVRLFFILGRHGVEKGESRRIRH